jgi:translation initiation factor IF-2
MSKLLFNVAKELNVGTTTIVEFLAKKGHSIENKPIAKVTDDMYKDLTKQFQSSINEKAKADSIVIGTRPAQKKEEVTPVIIKRDKPVLQISLGKAKEETPAPKPEVKAPTPIPVSTPVAPTPVAETKVETKVEAKVEVAPRPAKPVSSPVVEKQTVITSKQPELMERAKVDLTGPKILGKINLDAQKPKPSENKPSPKKEEQPRPNNSGAGNNNQNQPRRDDRRNNNNNTANNSGNGNNQNRPPQEPKPKQPKVERMVSAPRIEIVPEVQKILETPEMYRAEAPTLKGLKVLGKITLEERPVAKKKVPGQFNRPGAPGSAAAGSEADRKRKRQRKKISQPLTEDAVKKIGAANQGGNNTTGGNPQGTGGGQGQNRPAGQGGGQGQNRQGGGGFNRPAGQGTGQGGGGFNRPAGQGTGQGGGGFNRPAGQGTGQGGGGFNRPAGQGTGQGGGGFNRPAGQGNGQGGNRPGYQGGANRAGTGTAAGQNTGPKEISKKDIDDQIKATMARLGGGGKNKRQKMRRGKRDTMREKQDLIREAGDNGKLQLTEFVSVSEIASLMDVSVTEVITTCFNLGVIVSINQRLDAEVLEFIASEYGFEIEFISAEEQIEQIEVEIDNPEDLLPRAPIVTVMGHVDHGKTSLLDHIRKANVVSGEAGGITQHIGAYEVKLENGKRITFLDTPGHEAFTAMRARGAKVTDIAIIIISADDNIMPQTKEAISHAQAAGVPMIFAINKIDKAGADPERIKNELAQMNLLVEDWGGKYQSQEISAKKGTNIELLLEKILLEAELLDLKANPNKRASGTVIEASLDKGRGYVTKILVQEGTLNEGDPIVASEFSGKIKAMFNERGQRVKTAGPSAPVLILGLGGAPQAGEKFKETPTETEARQLASKRAQISREQSNRASKRISLDEIGRRLALGNFKELNLIIKGDVDGSVEALADSLIKQSIDTVKVNVIHKAVGAIIESDILLASASDAIVIGFQVRPSLSARKLAEREGVEVKTYSIIYEAIDEIRSAIEGMLEPTKEEKIEATVEVRDIFKNSKIGTIAGCYVQDGKLLRNNFIRVIRDGIVVFPVKEGANGKLGSLKRYKDDVKEIRVMMECGLTIDGFNDIQVGDTIESYDIIEVKQKLK